MKTRRKSMNNIVVMTVKLPMELRDKARDISIEKDISISQVVRGCLRDFVQSADEEKEVKKENQDSLKNN